MASTNKTRPFAEHESFPEVAYHQAPIPLDTHNAPIPFHTDDPTPYKEDVRVYEKYDAQAAYANSKGGRICGIRRKRFFIAVILAFVVVAAAVGGGVGGSIASKNNSNASSAVSPEAAQTSTASAPESSATPQYFTGCNNANDTYYSPSVNGERAKINDTVLSYRKLCATNFADSSSGLNKNITKAKFIDGLSTLDDCIDACAQYNLNRTREDERPSFDKLCSGVVYFFPTSGGNTRCDLNRGVVLSEAQNVSYSWEKGQQAVSTVLQWDAL